MKCGVVTFPGSNCNHDMIYALGNVLKQEVIELWHKDSDIQNCDLIVLPGGFSYGDYLRSGAIARFSPIMDSIIQHANNGGMVLGICNGFQILCESGLLPGALLHNNQQKFICKNVFLKPSSKTTPITKQLNEEKSFKIPIAHGEGRYFADDKTLKELTKNDQVIFQYCDENGVVSEEVNPNGSCLNIAGISNANKNVFGMMPHPERAVDLLLNNTDGKLIFESLLN
ncbi:MAG: phosphoribosylformylglycinamidine synthase I [Crocinitomicaceae bacterium]|nr:phosphoribosylformylglycinamidine synthase I [Crocinitomicaceae bacterium]|tara:strand:- start:1350 stop:2030 length:681 start_codon:yes stop_codon:yes gene_type:complete